MKTVETQLWEIFVPYHKNNGEKYNIRHHRIWDNKVMDITQGMTIMKLAKGKWMTQSGKKYRDTVIPVRIACERKHIIRIMEITRINIRHRLIDFVLLINLFIIKNMKGTIK